MVFQGLNLRRNNMSVYLIADIKVTDGGWVPDYAAHVHKIVERHGGRYLSRSGNIETLEGSGSGSTLIAIMKGSHVAPSEFTRPRTRATK